MSQESARFYVGQLIRHQRFGYRGVVVDVDPAFQLSEEWYDEVARSRPPKDRPWYHVLRHGTDQVTYVAERHLAAEPVPEPVQHPLLERYFRGFSGGRYQAAQSPN